MDHIRNFSIIAHIDHGKSTLADRIIQICGGLTDREMENQVLDSMDLERERGITIKAQTAALLYRSRNGKVYNLNLIDTPGHVDFSYEVSRSLSVCEGALLVVDASQGVEAQTIANYCAAIELGVEIVPVLNKIDLKNANTKNVIKEIEEIIGICTLDAKECSAKTGLGIKDVLEAIIERVPPPSGDPDAPLQALIIDSWFDNYIGVVMLVRIVNGTLSLKNKIKLIATGAEYLVDNLGVFTPRLCNLNSLSAGQVGFIIAGIRELSAAKVGDTITCTTNSAAKALPGFKEVKPQVFAGLYTVKGNQYDMLRESLEKLKLNDASLQYQPELSQALGPGFRCGFLGLLHMEIVQERLEREFNMDLIATAPNVVYEVIQKDGSILLVENPADMPELSRISEIREPVVDMNLYMPQNCIGPVIALCYQKRGLQINMQYHGRYVHLKYEIPMAEIALDFFDKLKSVSHGYASMDYVFKENRPSDIVKIDILINGDKIDALSIIVHKLKSQYRAKEVATRMREIIPRQMYDVSIQAAIGSHIIARENIKALRKSVLAKCYGGDITRKKKLLEKQKEGKKRMKQIGLIEIPQEAFLAILRIQDKQ